MTICGTDFVSGRCSAPSRPLPIIRSAHSHSESRTPSFHPSEHIAIPPRSSACYVPRSPTPEFDVRDIGSPYHQRSPDNLRSRDDRPGRVAFALPKSPSYPPPAPDEWSYLPPLPSRDPTWDFGHWLDDPVDPDYKRSDKWWFQDANYFPIRVDDTEYKLHHYTLKKYSNVLKELLDAAPQTDAFGAMAYTIDDVDKSAWELILSILYPSDMMNPGSDIHTVDEWVSVSTAAFELDMPQIHSLALQKIEVLATPADQIALATTETGVYAEKYLVPAFTELCMRKEEPSLEEGQKIGMENLFRVQSIRKEIKERIKTMVEKEVSQK